MPFLSALFVPCVLLAQSSTFEVASVKLAPERSGEARFVKMNVDQARVSYENVTLRFLITVAYGIGDDRLTGGESWTDSSPYDVTARLPEGASKSQVPAMLQSLLAERFQLVVHKTSKMMSAYDLVISKGGPRFESVPVGGAGSNYILRGRIEGPELSMAALAGILSRQVGRPVVDTTHLEGPFNVRLKWRPDDAAVDPDKPSNAPSIYTALQEQLGLQLIPRKEPIAFLVIDHANRTPAEN